MNTLRNRVQLIGNVGSDPEIKTLEEGRKLAKLSVATNEVYYNEKGEKITDTQWHVVKAWGKLADIVEKFVEKGKEVVLEGKLVHRTWEDKEGHKRYSTEIVVNEILLL